MLPFPSVKCNCYRLTGGRIFTGPQFSKAYLHKHTGKLRWFDLEKQHHILVLSLHFQIEGGLMLWDAASTWLILKAKQTNKTMWKGTKGKWWRGKLCILICGSSDGINSVHHFLFLYILILQRWVKSEPFYQGMLTNYNPVYPSPWFNSISKIPSVIIYPNRLYCNTWDIAGSFL